MKNGLFACLTVLCSSGLYSQGLYFKVGGGYGLPMGSQQMDQAVTFVQVTTDITETQTTGVNGSYGEGININAAIGYKFSPFIGVDLNLNYLLGSEISGTSSASAQAASFSITDKRYSEGFFAAPSVMFMAGSGNVRPYGLIGVIAGSVQLTHDTEISVSGVGDSPVVASQTQETKGELAFGFRGGIGVDFYLSDLLGLYAEAVFNTISYYPKESKITKLTVDGEDVLAELTVRERETVYVDELIEQSTSNGPVIDENKPLEQLKAPLPLSSLVFNIGLKFRLATD